MFLLVETAKTLKHLTAKVQALLQMLQLISSVQFPSKLPSIIRVALRVP